MSFITAFVLLFLALSVFANDNEHSRTRDYTENKSGKTTETDEKKSTTRQEINYKYKYTAPETVIYDSHNYPVYSDDPPGYVYKIRNSGSKFDNLITGLALYNLGKASQTNGMLKDYVAASDESCMLIIQTKDRKFDENLPINCTLMSAFILLERGMPDKSYLPSLPTATTTSTSSPLTKIISAKKNDDTTEVKATVVDPLKLMGPSIQVTNDTNCTIINRVAGELRLKETFGCELLEAYSLSSFHTSDSTDIATKISSLCPLVLVLIQIVFFCRRF